MATLKAYEVDRYIEKPDQKLRSILLFGPDAGLVSERADILAKKTGVDLKDPFSTIRLNADDVADDKSRLLDEAFTVGMFGGERLIRISGSTRKNLLDAVKPVLQEEMTGVWIILEAGDLNNKSALRTSFEKSTFGIALPCYQDDAKIIDQLIGEELINHGFRIQSETISFLRSFLGGDRMASRNELRKLALYAHGENEITKEHVLAIVGDASLFDANDVIDAVATGNLVELENNLERVLQEGGSPDVLLLSALRHFQLLHELRGKMELHRLSAKAVIDGARPPIFYQRKAMMESVVSRLPLLTIEKILDRLQKASFEARENPELGHSIAGTSLLAAVLESRFADR